MAWRFFGNKSSTTSVASGTDTNVDLKKLYKRILTPIDMRHATKSGKAIGVAAEFTKAFRAEYFMMTVSYPFGTHLTDDPDAKEAEFNEYVSRISKKTGLKITPVFRLHETASTVITQVSKEFEIDMIVMASHDPRITDHIFNSNASEVARHTSCSVMVVR